MCRTFNSGVGMVIAVDPAKADAVAQALVDGGEKVYRIGRLARRDQGEACLIHNVDSWSAETAVPTKRKEMES